MSFHDLQDDFEFQAELEANGLPPNPVQVWRERCAKCSGRGLFGTYRVGKCFACKGAGYFERKTAPEVRAKAKANAAAKKAQAVESWAEAHPEAMAWIIAKGPRFEFAASMGAAIAQYGHLTEKQLAAVERLRIKDAERDAAWAAEKAARDASAPVIDIGKIEAAFATALGKGYKRIALRIGQFRFKPAPVTGANAGAVYVTQAGSGDYLGKVQAGKFQRIFAVCDEAMAAQVVEAASDPEAAAIAYGKRFGQCAVCGKELTNHASIDAGIGPICATKFGWG